jgi:hypothetical protein
MLPSVAAFFIAQQGYFTKETSYFAALITQY